MQLPQSKFNRDRLLTEDNMVTGGQLEKKLAVQLDALAGLSAISSKQSEVMDEPEAVVDGAVPEEEGAAETPKPVAPAKTEVKPPAAVLDEISKKNNYKLSHNSGQGDMPKVFAFEVENNIRGGITELLRPLLA